MWWLWWRSGSCFIGRNFKDNQPASAIFHKEVIKCPILGVLETNVIPWRTSSKLFMHFQHRWVFNRRRLLSWTGRGWALLSKQRGMERVSTALHITEAEHQESRSGAAGWWCLDWEQREQLMIAYQRPRFTHPAAFGNELLPPLPREQSEFEI